MFSEGKCWYYGFATLLTKYTMEKITALPLVVQDFNSTCSHSLEFFIFRNQITHCLNSWTFISINKIFQLCTIHLKCWQIRILTWFSVALLFSFIYCSKCICWRCNIGLPFLVMEDFRINQGSWNLAFFLWKENKRVKVSRTAPFFYFKQGTFYWNSWRCIFQVHPLHFIGLGQPSPPTVWLSATLSIATSLFLISMFHTWLSYSFFRILLQKQHLNYIPMAVTKCSLTTQSVEMSLALAFLFLYKCNWSLHFLPGRLPLFCAPVDYFLWIEVSSQNQLFALELSLTSPWLEGYDVDGIWGHGLVGQHGSARLMAGLDDLRLVHL